MRENGILLYEGSVAMSRQVFISSATCFLLALLIGPSHGERHTLVDRKVIVSFDAPLQNSAMEVLKIYPSIQAELLKDLGWSTDFSPEILLIKDSASFKRAVGSDLVTALAIPQKDLIVVDYSRMNVYPFTLATTLKHELCHLELHHHIAERTLPRWFDEGVCQWVTGGFAEVMTDGNHSILREAALSNRLISFKGLTERFPLEGKDFFLAYEESRSVVEYIKREFGVSGVRSILKYMRQGDNLGNAVQKSLLIPLDELEKRWRLSITQKTLWFSYISDNFYEIVFLFAALITIYGFFRTLSKKREYKNKDEDEEREEGKR